MAIPETVVREMLKKHGGEFHGPRVEHLSIPEAGFWSFLRETLDLAKRADLGIVQFFPPQR